MKKNGINKEMFLGIDLGTTTSQMAIVDPAGIVQILTNMDGDMVTPSIVSVAEKKPTIGKVARQDRFFYPDKVAEQFKRIMARVTDDGNYVSVITGADCTEFTAVMLSAEVISYLKKSAEERLGQTIEKAVISVPAYFQRIAKKATKEAGVIAGFKEVHIVDEPTAGATFYGLAKGQDQKIAVFDFGGGTFDISILQLRTDGTIDQIAVDGDPECGGSNIDEAIFQQAREFVESKGGKLDPQNDLAEWMEALDACKQAKEMLSHKDTAIIPLRVGSDRFSMELSYEQLKEYSAKVIETLKDCCTRALQKKDLQASEIDNVVLIGGSTRLRFVPEIIKDIFGKEPVIDTDPDMAVAKGDAILAAAYFAKSDSKIIIGNIGYLTGYINPTQIAGRDLCVAAITEKSGDGHTEYNCPIIPSGAKLPFEATECFTPIDARHSVVKVKLIDGAPGELSSNFSPLQQVEVDVQPTSGDENDGRIEFKVKMDIEGMVDINVRDKVLNKPVPIKFKFHTELSDSQINEQRDQLVARHSS